MIQTEPLDRFAKHLPQGWRTAAFGDLLYEPVKNGVYKAKEFHGSGAKVVNMGELFAFDFINGQEMKRVQLDDREASKYLLQSGDLLFARRSLVLEGSGKCSLVVGASEPTTFESSIIRARPNPEEADSRFLLYLFQSPLGRAIMAAISTRTAVSGIRASDLADVGLPVPPLDEQRRIAGILSAYDDLIENCQRRIRILEVMARRLYREWFVHFRYPNHESIPLVESPLGPIPQGWEVKTVGESFEIIGGGTPSKTEPGFWDDGDIQWYSPRDLTAAGTMFIDDSVGHITPLGLAKSSARMFPAESVMLTSRATIGAVAINTQPACTNQGFITCLPNDQMPLFYLYNWVTENVEQFDRLASGATFKEISRGVFKTIDVLRPKESVVCRFEELVEPACRQILNLQRQTANLRRTRDLLLPRLIGSACE